jgi:hypothetical protein
MSREKRKLPGVTTHFVVARDEATGKLSSCSIGFATPKEAESYKRQYVEMPDPKGEVLTVEIETLLTGTFPSEFKPKH